MGYSASIRASLDEVIAHLLSKAENETVRSVLQQICSIRLNDDEVYRIIDFSISANNADVSITALSVLKDTKQYVMMTSKYIISLLSRSDLSAVDKTAVLRIILEFNVDAKTMNGVITNYLCFNNDSSEIRLAVLPILFSKVAVVQTGTVEDYILNCTTDGENKPTIVEQIFSLDLNISFFNNLLTKYISSTTDSNVIKDKVIAILTSKGLKIDSHAFINYICHSNDSHKDKVNFVKKMLQNGTQMRGDTVNAYLESILSEQFNSELFALIVNSANNVSEKALSNYLLLCKDRDSQKVMNFVLLAKQCHKNIADIRCYSICSGQKISGCILPLYVLSTPDPIDVTKEITDFMIGSRAKLNTDISAADMGTVKLKKFVSANRNELTSVTSQICKDYKI